MQRTEVKYLSIFPQSQMIRCDRPPLRMTKLYRARNRETSSDAALLQSPQIAPCAPLNGDTFADFGQVVIVRYPLR
ncbi:hypothetical protein D0A34_13525 [Microcoleus vaginatus PCC 9802]|uniref:hypothetical protein n=1 Tax=Microcoleus vaginatus TaxID=119532 RepID=UPI00020D2EEC|nr:hypothetical protein MicvaDRAFT_4246 [Microcoleus vaginatus FGP-2]UNU19755.1 hypothetical protein D0A34_13525 [Microcoleus vaginatus PCC 9802]